MSRKFSELRNKMSPEAQKKSAALTEKLLINMPLQELRQARALSQEQLARVLKIKQASVSKLERRTDMYVQTLRSYIQAMGGDPEIIARFPEGNVRITQFAEGNSKSSDLNISKPRARS